MCIRDSNYAVDEESLAGTGLEVTHINLLDGTVEGVESKKDRVFSVQYHPAVSYTHLAVLNMRFSA